MRLVIDTSTPAVSLGLLDKGEWIETLNRTDLPQQQSKVLFNLIQELLQPLKIEKKEIKEIAIGKGPGSYTGLRMGITVAKAWAFAQQVPLYTFSSTIALERTQKKMAGAQFPQVEFLELTDFEKIEDLNTLEPTYVNDHFAS
jgi:tRNA threonylcarbamoyladenosine biosynthesis protein TsaB